MRKLVSLLLMLSLLLCVGMAARAEGAEIPEEWIGEGDTTVVVFVEEAGGQGGTIVYVLTNETNLQDALVNAGLISGEKAPWGFNVTTVRGVSADYEGKGEYWGIYVYDQEISGFDRLETAIGSTPVAEGDLYLFTLEN